MTTTEEPAAIHLAPPAGWTAAQRDQFLAWVRESSDDSDSLVEAPTTLRSASTKAAYSVVADLINQGWDLSCGPTEVLVRAPIVNGDPDAERERVRKQELLKRDEHLRRSSVRRFIGRMETQRRRGDQQVSVFSLMRDGHDLAASLREVSRRGSEQGSGLRSAIDPYVQVVASGERCQHTGLRLTDIWRYFRLTWTNQYTSVPGRTTRPHSWWRPTGAKSTRGRTSRTRCGGAPAASVAPSTGTR